MDGARAANPARAAEPRAAIAARLSAGASHRCNLRANDRSSHQTSDPRSLQARGQPSGRLSERREDPLRRRNPAGKMKPPRVAEPRAAERAAAEAAKTVAESRAAVDHEAAAAAAVRKEAVLLAQKKGTERGTRKGTR